MTRRISDPLVTPTTGTGQWTQGEELDDLILHRRLDLPLEQLGSVARTWNQDLDSFYGAVPPSTVMGIGPVPFVPISNSIGAASAALATPGWDAVNDLFQIRYAGVYQISWSLVDTAGTAFRATMDLNGSGVLFPHSQQIDLGRSTTSATGGTSGMIAKYLDAGSAIQAFVLTAITAPSSGVWNWLNVQQLTWG